MEENTEPNVPATPPPTPPQAPVTQPIERPSIGTRRDTHGAQMPNVETKREGDS